MREALTQRLLDEFRVTCTVDWEWFEKVLTYDNARLSHALILSGRWSKRAEAFEIGLRSLRWLMRRQTAEAGHFRPIGSKGFHAHQGSRAHFDQQPIEASASVSACVEAWKATGHGFWINEASRAFEWFLGRNDLGQPLYDARSGACFDGLLVDRVNLNQGAESKLAFLLALQEMRRVESTINAFEQPLDALETESQNFVDDRSPVQPLSAASGGSATVTGRP